MENCITLDRMVMAPTAISPPYFSREELKHIFSMLSVDCMINGDSPSAIHGKNTLGEILKYFFLSLRVVFFPHKNRITHTADTPWEMIVASAAPRTPICIAKIKIGSRTILHTAPMTTLSILTVANPWAVINAFIPSAACTNKVPTA